MADDRDRAVLGLLIFLVVWNIIILAVAGCCSPKLNMGPLPAGCAADALSVLLKGSSKGPAPGYCRYAGATLHQVQMIYSRMT